jgi:SAM-dependent methyltransferase
LRKRGRRTPPLPPADLLGGVGPGDYWQVGERTVDLGSGLGRVAWPLAARLGWRGRYVGLEPAPAYVEWCRQHLPLPARRFRFVHADIRSTTYNVDGAIPAEHYTFPWPAESFDLVIATSLFTHLLPRATGNYLAQASRCLRRGGRLFASFFLLDEPGRAAVAAGWTYPTFAFRIPEGLLHDAAVPEDGVAYEPTWLAHTLEGCALRIVSAQPGSWKTLTGPYYQDLVVAEKV